MSATGEMAWIEKQSHSWQIDIELVKGDKDCTAGESDASRMISIFKLL